MEDLKESSDVLLTMFSDNLFQSVIVLGGKRFFSVFSFTRWYLEAFSVGMTCLPFLWNESLFFLFQLYCLLFCRTYSNVNLFYSLGGCAILDVVTYYQR
jgi:hypothetical protein